MGGVRNGKSCPDVWRADVFLQGPLKAVFVVIVDVYSAYCVGASGQANLAAEVRSGQRALRQIRIVAHDDVTVRYGNVQTRSADKLRYAASVADVVARPDHDLAAELRSRIGDDRKFESVARWVRVALGMREIVVIERPAFEVIIRDDRIGALRDKVG